MADDQVLIERGEAAAKGFGEALSSLTGTAVTVAPVGFERGSQPDLGGPLVQVPLQGPGVEGFMAFPEKAAVVVAELVMGQDPAGAPDSATDLHLSAFGEVSSQMASALASAFKLPGLRSLDPVATPRVTATGGVAWTFVLDVPNAWNGSFMLDLPESAAEGHSAGASKTAAPRPTGGSPKGTHAGAPALAGGGAVQMDQVSGPTGGNIGLLMDVPLKLTVELGRTTKLVKEILALAPGSVVELDKLAGEPVDILVNERLIAKGEVVVIDENFGVRITEIVNPEERLHGIKP